MKRKTYFMSMLLLMAGVFFSCDNKDSEEPELKNHMMVNETEVSLQGMAFSYNTTETALAEGKTRGSYPLSIHIYKSRPYFVEIEKGSFKMAEDSAPLIQFSLYTSANGLPDEGKYTWDQNSSNAGNCISAWQSSKQLGMQPFRAVNEGTSQILMPQYKQVPVSITKLEIKKVEDRTYEFFFEGIDHNGETVSGYYKGHSNYFCITEDDEIKIGSEN